MNSVFLVKTPLQLLNAIEAKHYYGIHSEDCVLILMADRKSKSQLMNLTTILDSWGSVIDINDATLYFTDPLVKVNSENILNKFRRLKLFSKSIFYIRRLNRIGKYLGAVDFIFVGHAKYIYMNHFVNSIYYNKVVSLDDGNATILMSKERAQGKLENSGVGIKKRIKSLAKEYIQGVKYKPYSALEFFTIYDVTPGFNDSVVKNEFKYLRSRLEALDVSDAIYFIGSPISETGIMSQYEYLEHLKRVKLFYGEAKFVYISHRRESNANLDEISRELNVDIVKFDYPIEYQLAINGPRPYVMASFISSALDSCSLIFGDNMKMVAFKLDIKEGSMKDEIDSIYDAYEHNENTIISVERNF